MIIIDQRTGDTLGMPPAGGEEPTAPAKGPLESFHNPNAPSFEIMHERPEHRIILMLKAEMKSNAEIAKLTGYTQSWISQVLRQPWAQDRLLDLINTAGRDAIQSLLQGAAADSVLKLIELRDGENVDASVQLRASQDLLDRYLGKATQRVESQSTVTHVSENIQEIDAELARLQTEENRLLGVRANN